MIKILVTALIVSQLILFTQVYFTSESQKETQAYKVKCDSLQKVSDSLYAELYPCSIELNRHQVAYQLFLQRNPKAAEQYGNIISNETE